MADRPAWEVVIAPDGSRFAIIGETDGGRAIFQRSAEDMTFRLVPGTEGSPSAPAFSPDGEWIAYIGDDGGIYRVSLVGGQPQVVHPGGDLEARDLDWGAPGWIVFSSQLTAAGTAGVHLVPESGGTPEPLFDSAFRVTTPTLLPDGSGVLFRSEGVDPGDGSGDAEERDRIGLFDFAGDSVGWLGLTGADPKYSASGHILYMDGTGGLWGAPFDLQAGAVTGEAKPLLQGLRSNSFYGRYSLSEAGTLVYGAGRSQLSFVQPLDLVVFDLEGTETRLDLPSRDVNRVEWSPDGRRVVFGGWTPGESGTDADRHLWLYDVEVGNQPSNLTEAGDNVRPIWSPDGTRVAFSSEREGTDGQDLFIKEVYSDLPPRHVLSLPGSQYPTDWPAEDLLVVEHGSPSGIILVDLVGDSAVVRGGATGPGYYSPDADVDDMVVSPDGALAAYNSNESGRDEIYVRAFPEPRASVRVSEGGGQVPVWSPDGDRIYYRSGPAMFVAEVARDPSFTVVSRRELFRTPSSFPSLHPDGDRFIGSALPNAATGVAGGEPGENQHIVIHNWFTELKQIFGEGG